MHLRARRLRRAAWFFASYPASAREEVLAAWDGLAPGAPPALTSICTLTKSQASAFGQYLGDERALRRLVAPLARIGGARFSSGASDFLALQRGAYQNYADVALRSPQRAYYGANLARLRQVKAAVDPGGRFAPAQGIR